MRIAIVHPYPVSSRSVGGTTRVYSLVRHLAARHEVHVFTHAGPDLESDLAAIEEIAQLGALQRVFAQPAATPPRKLGWALSRTPYFVGRNRNPDLERALADLDHTAGIDVVHVEFAYLAPLLAGVGGRAARTLAEQETMSIAVERLSGVPLRRRTLYETYLATELSAVLRFEERVLPSFDRLFAITAREADYFGTIVGHPVSVLPHAVDASAFTPAEREPLASVLLFVGNFGHAPNRHSLGWFVEEVWPLIQEKAGRALLHVVGPGLPDADRLAVEARGARVLGRVEDLVTAYREAAVFVNPIQSGSGMRGKVLEAFACGRPVVSTQLGMEGIAARDGVHFDLADEPAAFATTTVELLRSPAMRMQRGTAARELVEEKYDVSRVFGRLEVELEAAARERRSRCEVA